MKQQLRCTVAFDGTGAPGEVCILRAGWNRFIWRDKRTATVFLSEAKAAQIIGDFQALGHDMVWDYDHATQPGASRPGEAIAAGWISALNWNAGRGLVATVKWTEQAVKLIAEGAYRFFSPVFDWNQETLQFEALHSVALTNIPATEGIQPLAASADGVSTMTVDAIFDKLGLSAKDFKTPEALIAAAVSAIEELMKGEKPNDADQAASALATELGWADVKNRRALVERAKALSKAPTIDPAKYVTVEVAKAMSDELAALHARELARDTAAFIDGGMKIGKIHGSMKGMWERAYQTDANQARKDLETAPIIAPTTGQYTGSEPTPSSKRGSFITAAASKYVEVKEAGMTTVTKAQFVSAELAAANLDHALTAEELKLIG